MYESFLFFLTCMRKSKREEEKERKRKDLPYYYDDDEDDVFFSREIYDRECTRQRKKCADGLSDFDFIFSRYLASCDDYTYL